MNKLGSMLENWYSQPTISVGFISTNSTNCRSKIFVKKKNPRRVQRAKLEFAKY